MLSLAIITVGFGQEKGKLKKKPKINELKEELHLSEEQTHKILEARTVTKAKMKVLRADEKLTKEEKRTVAKKIKHEHKMTMDKVLTKEQKEKSTLLRKERKAKLKQNNKVKRDKLKTYRSAFDGQISEEDRIEIARLRNVLKKGRKHNDGERPSKEERIKFKEAHKSDFDSLEKLSTKYEEDVKLFMEKNGVMKDELPRKGKARKLKQKGPRKGKGNNNRTSRFLLMEYK